MDEDSYVITLRCIDCDNVECRYARKYIDINSKEGCTRIVDEDLYIEYENRVVETLPFVKQMKTKNARDKCIKEIFETLYKVYSCPFGKKLGKNGKILASFNYMP